MMKQKNNKNIFTYIILILSLALLGTGSVNASQSSVDIGTADNYVILAKSGISTTGTTAITGNIGASPIDSTAITGFGLIMDSSNVYSTSSLITGKIYASDYSPPTPTVLTTAISDMQTAYTDAAGRTETSIITELGAGDITSMTLAPGLYKWGTGALISGAGLTLSGSSSDVWIFQIAQDLTVANGAIITLSGGAQAKNIFWQVAGQTTLGTTSQFKGIILCQTLIDIQTGATLNGRALAQTAVTLDASTVTPSTSSSSSSSDSESTSSSSSDSGSSASEDDWECGDWSTCSSKGLQTRTCTQTNNPTELTKTKSCIFVKTNTETQTNENSPDETNQNDQEIGQEINEQINERKMEIKSGDYTNSFGQLLRVRALAHDVKELKINDVAARTDLNITAETDAQGKTKFKTTLRNGQEIEIKIMPDTASEKALEMLKVNVCSSDNNCTIQLKDVGGRSTEKVQYEMQLDKHSKVLGLFQRQMRVKAYVDAETGKTSVHKPWWAFMANELDE